MESQEAAYPIEDLLNFSIADVDDDVYSKPTKRSRNAMPSVNVNGHDSVASFDVLIPEEPGLPYPDCAEEEELEWQYEFPSVETFIDIASIQNQQSPVSVLENSNSSTSTSTSTSTNGSTITNNCNGISIVTSCCGSLRVPVRARSKRRTRRRDTVSNDSWWGAHENVKTEKPVVSKVIIGRKCQHCGAEKTPQWRAGPMGPKTLCNACGVRYKSGRLVPEYRPANSPTFSSELHSNSHRKVIEMRRQKQLMGIQMEVVAVRPCG